MCDIHSKDDFYQLKLQFYFSSLFLSKLSNYKVFPSLFRLIKNNFIFAPALCKHIDKQIVTQCVEKPTPNGVNFIGIEYD